MNCRDFEEKLHLFVGDSAPAVLRAAAKAHLAECGRCRRLFESLSGAGAALDAVADEGLTTSILRRTSGGPVCAKIEDRLCGWVDGTLTGLDADLIAEHIEHCAGCREIAVTLRALSADLPAMAEVEPDVRFVLDVLDRTSRRRVERPTPLEAVAQWWGRLVRRPRFAQELAYCAAMVLLLIGGGRSGFVGEAPLRDSGVPVWAAGGFAHATELLAGLVHRVGDDLGAAPSRPAVPKEAKSISIGVKRTSARVVTTLDVTGACARRVGGALMRWDTIEIWGAIRDLRDGIGNCWQDSSTTEPSSGGARIPEHERQQVGPFATRGS